MIKKRLTIIYLILITVMVGGFDIKDTHAARIFFDKTYYTLGLGEHLGIPIYIDTQGEEINAIEGTAIFPDEALTFIDAHDGGSIISLWVDPIDDNISTSQKDGSVYFSGIIPGGYNGNRGYIGTFFFEAKTIGAGAIYIIDQSVLLNDGIGTSINTDKTSLSFIVEKVGHNNDSADIRFDRSPPETFKPQISKDEQLFDGKYFLVFSTTDKDSGISKYEVQETKEPRAFADSWTIATSPYVLENQNLDTNIYVRVTDKAGNEIVVYIPAERESGFVYNWTYFWGIILIVILLLILYIRNYKNQSFI